MRQVVEVLITVAIIIAVLVVKFVLFAASGWVAISIFEWLSGMEVNYTREIVIGIGVFGAIFLGGSDN